MRKYVLAIVSTLILFVSSPMSIANMKIKVIIDQQEFTATLADNPTSASFYQLLPLEFPVSDFNRSEKIADLTERLDTTGAPNKYQGQINDITYYAPWGNLALFYQKGPMAAGLIYLGKFDVDVQSVLSKAQHIRFEK